MTIKESFRYTRVALQKIYSERESARITDMMLDKVTCISKLDRLTHQNRKLGSSEEEQIKNMIIQLLQYKPIQYILGEAWFYRLLFRVNPSVLIPRPETEELVQWVIEDVSNKLAGLPKNHQMNILDVGTGSGCIAIALKKNLPELNVIAIDKSRDALEVAKENASANQTAVSFYDMDITRTESTSSLPDLNIIISNPPYISLREENELQAQVKDYEPKIALFVPDNDPLFFYKAILKLSDNKLVTGGKLYFEAHQDHASDVAELLRHKSFKKVVLKKDISGNDRMVSAEKADESL